MLKNRLAFGAIFLAGCAGQVSYVRPTTVPTPGQNSALIEKSREAVWNAAVPKLGKQFFVINNLDKSSGLINVSYSGDPEKYIDCGRVISYVKNARGERTYNFAGAKAQENYEVMNPQGLFFVNRRMALAGRVNLVFEEVGPEQTRVTANTKYVLNRQASVRSVANNNQQNFADSISLNSGGSASFPPNADGSASECVSTGVLEQEILAAVK